MKSTGPHTEVPSGFAPSGDMAVVYAYHDYQPLARHGHTQTGRVTGYGRVWFVKSLVEECRGVESCRRSLVKEYEILAGLSHPGIVRAFSLTDIPGAGLSIILEYVAGKPLGEWLSEAPAATRRLAAGRLLEAMAYLHSQGLSHLDLKPENILMTGSAESPQPQLIDFNLSDGGAFVYSKAVGGNTRYGAPEQFAPGYEASPTADVWSLGMLLQEMRLGPVWKPLIRSSLREDPDRRPQDASAMLRTLRSSRRSLRTALWISAGAALAALIIALLLRGNGSGQALQPSAAQATVHDTVTIERRDTVPAPAVGAEALPASASPASGETLPDEYAALEREHDAIVYEVASNIGPTRRAMTQLRDEALRRESAPDTYFYFINRAQKLYEDLVAPFDGFRQRCPDGLLARHAPEWGTFWDHDIASQVQEVHSYMSSTLKELIAITKQQRQEDRIKEKEALNENLRNNQE